MLAVILSYLLARRLTRPIGELAQATRRLASGETGVAVPVGGDHELADLGTAFNDMSEQLAAAKESQRHFLESVSHELKTPLTSIRGYAEALEEDAVSRAEGARVIRAEAGRLQQLVADLLELARFGRAGFVVEHEPVDLAAVVDQAVARHRPTARALSVELSGSTRDGVSVLADEGRLLQVTSNLIENALRLTPAGGAVTVRARRRAHLGCRHRARTVRRGRAPGVRTVLSVRPLPQRAAGRVGPRPGDRQGARRRDGRNGRGLEPRRRRRRVRRAAAARDVMR